MKKEIYQEIEKDKVGELKKRLIRMRKTKESERKD